MGAVRFRCYVYLLFREDGITPFYVGKGTSGRWTTHERFKARGSNPHKENIIKAILAKGQPLIKKKVRICLTHEQACIVEQHWIAKLGRAPFGPLVNLTDGGEGLQGLAHREETKQKIRKALLGRKRPPPSIETRERLRQAGLGRRLTAQEKQKISNAKRGVPFSDEHRRKLSIAHLGKTRKAKGGQIWLFT